MSELQESISGLGPFAMYFGLSLLALVIFKKIYTMITPYDDWQLVKDQNMAAAATLFGAIIGFSIALSSAASQSVSLLDFAIWAVVALIAQLIAFALVRLYMPKIVQRIKAGELPAGVVLGGVSIAIGLLNAGSMSY